MQRKEEIIYISLKSFLEDGYDRFSMRDVGKEVGIKQPTLYYYFDDKLSLFKECAKHFFVKWNEVMQRIVPESGSLKCLIQTTCGFLGADGQLINELYGVKTNTGQYRLVFDIINYCPECMEYMNVFNEKYFETLFTLVQEAKTKGEIREDIEPESLYFMLSSLMEGSNIVKITDPGLDIEAYTQKTFNIIWNGIKAKEDER